MSIERRAEYRAPAKVNLALRVLGRRPDGLHELESIMAPVSLYDVVRIAARESAGKSRITCEVAPGIEAPSGPANLAWRAAESVLRALEVCADIRIVIEKRIPAQAGLGGGSSDAATVLRRLPALLGRRLARSRMLGLAAELGADVPFFIDCRPSIATGIGERLEPLRGFPRLALAIAVPPVGVDTAWAYANALPAQAKLPLAGGQRRVPLLRAVDLQLSIERLLSRLSNDFESGVAESVGDVDRVRTRLRELGAVRTVLSGSGSAMVGVFSSLRDARSAANGFGSNDRVFAVSVLGGPPATTTKSR